MNINLAPRLTERLRIKFQANRGLVARSCTYILHLLGMEFIKIHTVPHTACMYKTLKE